FTFRALRPFPTRRSSDLIMGAAAFLMAEMTGVPYSKIVVSAIFPAVLYFAGIFLMVHFEAKKLGLKGMPCEAIPSFFRLFLTKEIGKHTSELQSRENLVC